MSKKDKVNCSPDTSAAFDYLKKTQAERQAEINKLARKSKPGLADLTAEIFGTSERILSQGSSGGGY